MKVFLSWSGQQSRDAAVLLRDFIPQVLQDVEPWLAGPESRDAEPVANRIEAALAESDVAIACVTRENLTSTWLNYEVGIATATRTPVIPVLIDLPPQEVLGALSAYQAVALDKLGLRTILLSLNRTSPNPLHTELIDDIFDVNWPRFAQAMHAIHRAQGPLIAEGADGDLIEEQLKAIRDLVERIDQRLPTFDADARPSAIGIAGSEEATRPRVFVGSSTEGLAVAEAIQVGLDHVAEIVLWTQGAFTPSATSIESLVELAPRFDYAIITMTADDVLIKRGSETKAPRDNLIFELGLFTGVIGRARTFLVCPRDDRIELPSDLEGVTKLDFQMQRSDNNLEAAVGPVCARVKRVMGVV